MKRDKGKVYPGIALDHDLEKCPASKRDLSLYGMDVVNAIIINVSRDVPILIHSVNGSQTPVMYMMLQKAGFTIEWISMNVPTGDFQRMLKLLRENGES